MMTEEIQEGLEYVESELNNGTEAIFVTKDDKVYVTDTAFQRSLGLLLRVRFFPCIL